MNRPHTAAADEAFEDALYAAGRMEDVQRYLEAGRYLIGLPRDALERLFAESVRTALAEDRPASRQAISDSSAELALRGLPEPLDLLAPDMPLILAHYEKILQAPDFAVRTARQRRDLEQQMAQPKH